MNAVANTTELVIVMAQMDITVGDVHGNTQKIIRLAQKAKTDYQADLVVFPELAISGYLAEDLFYRSDFLTANAECLATILRELNHIDLILGHIQLTPEGLRNACSYIKQGKLHTTYYKQTLPNYGVFDEKRYFTAGTEAKIINVQGHRIALTICEDLWLPMVTAQAKSQGADCLISINASPYDSTKILERQKTIRLRIVENTLPIIYVANVGAHDDIVYDGGSFAMDKQGKLQVLAPSFIEALIPVKLDAQHQPSGSIVPPLTPEAELYAALVLGLKTYVAKNGFKGVVLGVSGGIDSALVLPIAVDALGADNVFACLLPSRYTHSMSSEDGSALCKNLGVAYTTLSIEPVMQAFLTTLAPEFKDLPTDTTEENLQARCRALLLMALSNKKGWMLLSTGNKSETAVGYCTLYGDMAGGYAPIKDLYKVEVYALARYRNSLSPAIPERIFTRAPSAELAPNQTDQDSLPAYEILDAILYRYLEEDKSAAEIIEEGFETATVLRIINMVQRNEYKRKQAAPGPKVSKRAFTRERRYPITCGKWV